MADDEAPLGQAAATDGQKKSAVKLCNAFRLRKALCPIDDSTFEEFEEDNLENFFLGFCRFLSSTPIPTYADDTGLRPRNPNNTRLIMVSSLKKYIGQVKEKIKELHPTHPDFGTANGDPSWFTSMMTAFVTECTRFHLKLKGNDDVVFGDTCVQPLYRNNFMAPGPTEEFEWFIEEEQQPATNRAGRLTSKDVISMVDMNYVCKGLMREADIMVNNNRFQDRCMLVTVFLAVGRGGEVKFNDYSEWQYHPRFQVTDIGWTELKVLEKYSCPMVPDADSYILDFYHALGCYWAVEKGLYRTQTAIRSGVGNYLFPSLHKITDRRVTAKVTDTIRRSLPRGTPKEVAAAFSAKSTRKAAVTEMALHPQCDLFETCARSGHNTGLSIDYYIDKQNIQRGLPGVKVLAGWENVHKHVCVARLECLGQRNKQAVLRLIKELFVVSVDLFQIGGSLFPVLKMVTASLIMYHQRVTVGLSPSNAISTYMRDCARAAHLVDPSFPELCPEATLDQWSSIIMADFKLRNSHNHSTTADLASIASSLDRLTSANANLNESVESMKRKMDERDAEYKQQSEQMQTQYSAMQSHFQEQNTTLVQSLKAAHHKLAFIRTPTSASSQSFNTSSSSPTSRNVRARLDYETNTTTTTDEQVSSPEIGSSSQPPATRVPPSTVRNTNNNNAPSTSATTASNNPPASNPTNTLMYNAKSRKVSESSSQKGFHVSDLIRVVQVEGIFANNPDWYKPVKFPAIVSNQSYARYCMQILKFIITEEDAELLKRPVSSFDHAEIRDLHIRLSSEVMDQMWTFEGLVPLDVRKQMRDKPKAGAKQASTYLPIGKRCREYKRTIWTATKGSCAPGVGDLLKVPLVHRNEIPEPGTPPGNRSIARLFRAA